MCVVFGADVHGKTCKQLYTTCIPLGRSWCFCLGCDTLCFNVRRSVTCQLPQIELLILKQHIMPCPLSLNPQKHVEVSIHTLQKSMN
jgi:hypothetical protein